MAGYVLIGALAAFGMICGLWILWGWFLPRNNGGAAVLTGPLEGQTLDTARRWIWLREMGFLLTPLLVLDGDLSEADREWLCCNGFEICSRKELPARLGIGEKEFD